LANAFDVLIVNNILHDGLDVERVNIKLPEYVILRKIGMR